MSLLSDIEVFHGPVTASQATLYVRFRGFDNRHGDYRLDGTISGPHCETAETLPATLSLTDQGPGAAVLAKCIIPDPCVWTVDLPSLYQIKVSLSGAAAATESINFQTGLRRLGVAGRSFLLDGQRWVLRGAADRLVEPPLEMGPFDIVPCEIGRRERLALIVPEADEAVCQATSQQGVSLLVVSTVAPSEHDIRRYGRWPSVAAVVVPVSEFMSIERAAAPNLLLGIAATNHELTQLQWNGKRPFDFVFCPADSIAAAKDLPCVAFRRIAAGRSSQELRRECERLQAVLTPSSLAGYVVL